VLYTELSSSSPSVINSLGRWTSSVSVSRPYDAVTPLRHLFPQPCSGCRDLTGWPLSSSVLSTPGIRLVKWSLQSRNGHKREALYADPPIRKLHVRPSSASPLFLFFLQLALATRPLEHLSHLFHSSPSKLFFCLHPQHWEEARK
jgi:hypothetical protein